MNNPTLLIFSDWFYPAYKAGGPIQSCNNLAKLLEKERTIYIITSNEDLDSTLENIQSDQWVKYSQSIKVIYLSKEHRTITKYRKLILQIRPEFIYFNSMFSSSFTLLPLLSIRKIDQKIKIILAPRGMLHAGALQYKSLKKKLFLYLSTKFGLYKQVYFHATDNQEVKDIKSNIAKKNNEVVVVPNVPTLPLNLISKLKKNEKNIRFVFISRLSQKKNLLYFIDLLCQNKWDGNIIMDVYGVNEESYWESCLDKIKLLPENIKVKYHGSIVHSKVEKALMHSHVFILPTHGENFGHAIFEAFAVGRPVIISDQTPWRNLNEKRIGWDIPLNNEHLWIETIERLLKMEQEEFDEYCQNALNFAKKYLKKSALKNKYLKLFSSNESR